MDTIERILALQKKAGITNKTLETAAGLSNGSMTKWKNREYSPNTAAIVSLARFFGVSTDYLLCLTNSPEPPSAENPLTEEEALLVDVYRKCSAAGRFRIIQFCMNECSQADEGNTR